MGNYLLYLFYALVFSLNFSSVCFAQLKVEKEIDVRASEVPQAAQAFINSLPFPTKTNWFFETNVDAISYEAKFKYKKRRYSVEFDTTGRLQDVEIEIKKSAIKKSVLQKIDSFLKEEFKSFSFTKIQLQLSGEELKILESLPNELKKIPTSLIKGYEVVVSGKKNSFYQAFEIFFDSTGVAKSIVLIKQRNTDHLEY